MRYLIRSWAVGIACVASVTGAAVPARAQQSYAIVDVTVIPMDRERRLEHHTVLVSNGRVASLGPVATAAVPAGAVRIDGRGKFLVPGLGDAHAHLSTGGGGTALAERALTLFALNGVTMVRSMYTEPHHAAARDRVARGEIVGPRTVIVSPALTGQTAATPEAARDAVRRYHAERYAAIKVLPGISLATFDALAAESRALRIPLVGHVPASVGLARALDAGYASIEHLDGYLEAMAQGEAAGPPPNGGFFGFGVLATADDRTIPALVAATKRAGTTIVPTEFEMETFTSMDGGAAGKGRPGMQYAPAALVDQWASQKDGFARGVGVTAERSARYRDLRRRLIRELHAAGVPIALGSDGFNLFAVPGFSTFDELETLVAAGLTPFAALAAGTVQVARLIGLPDVTGTIAPGGVADLILLDGDPLADIANVRRQAGVMLAGAWMPRSDIERRLGELAASAARP